MSFRYDLLALFLSVGALILSLIMLLPNAEIERLKQITDNDIIKMKKLTDDDINRLSKLKNDDINRLSKLTDDDINKLKNNTFPSLILNGSLKINTESARPIVINKKADKTALISYTLNDLEYNAHGVDGNGNKWSGNGFYN